MKVGLIGNGFHSKRIQKILKKKNINFFYINLADPITIMLKILKYLKTAM